MSTFAELVVASLERFPQDAGREYVKVSPDLVSLLGQVQYEFVDEVRDLWNHAKNAWIEEFGLLPPNVNSWMRSNGKVDFARSEIAEALAKELPTVSVLFQEGPLQPRSDPVRLSRTPPLSISGFYLFDRIAICEPGRVVECLSPKRFTPRASDLIGGSVLERLQSFHEDASYRYRFVQVAVEEFPVNTEEPAQETIELMRFAGQDESLLSIRRALGANSEVWMRERDSEWELIGTLWELVAVGVAQAIWRTRQ